MSTDCRKWLKVGCILLALILIAGYAENPLLVGGSDLEVPVKEMPEELREDIIRINGGIYSGLPLIPIYIKVLEYDGADALVRTYYFPFGTVERVMGPDGPSITKPLH